jgi:hypothetical protein
LSVVEFEAFQKIPRLLKRTCTITEKIDGTNAQVYIPEDDGPILAGSRNRWLTVESDNFGFARWVADHADELRALGPGRHFGEWWGCGIQRRYGLSEKRFSLFNTGRWRKPGGGSYVDELPPCVHVVPVIYEGPFSTIEVEICLEKLGTSGSVASPGFTNPEGIVIWHHASRTLHKVTLGDDGHKEGRAV